MCRTLLFLYRGTDPFLDNVFGGKEVLVRSGWLTSRLRSLQRLRRLGNVIKLLIRLGPPLGPVTECLTVLFGGAVDLGVLVRFRVIFVDAVCSWGRIPAGNMENTVKITSLVSSQAVLLAFELRLERVS